MNIVRLISYLTVESQKVLLVLEFLPNIMAHMSVWHEDEAAPRTRV